MLKEMNKRYVIFTKNLCRKTNTVMNSRISKLRFGVIIYLLLSLLSLPLGYYRNWILSKFCFEAVGNYALVILVSNIVTTFLLFGGQNVYATFLPKISRRSDKFSFIFSSSLISATLLIAFCMLLLMFPTLITSLLSKDIDSKHINIILFFIMSFGLGQLLSYSMIGLQEYGVSAFLNNSQLFVICTVLTINMFLFADYFIANSFSFLLWLIGGVWLINSLGCIYIIRRKLITRFKLNLPAGYWKQAIFSHLGTIQTFFYNYIDQLLIFSFLGKVELAKYFLTIQLAKLVSFLTLRLSAVFQSSFATILPQGNKEQQENLYEKIAKHCSFLSFCISSFLVLFGYEVLILFGKSMKYEHTFLFLLVFRYFFGCLGNVHSMIIVANEKNESFFIANTIVVIIQVTVSIILIKPLGIMGVIIAHIASCLVGQILLAVIIRKQCNINFYKPMKFISMVLLLAAIYGFTFWKPNLLGKGIIFLISVFFTLFFLQIKIKEIIQSKK